MKRWFLKFFRIFGLAITLIMPLQAMAQEDKVSESEKAVFAFFKLAHGFPDYRQWIENSPRYNQQTDSFSRNEAYERESLRLRWNFGTFDPDIDFVTINTATAVKYLERDGRGYLKFAFPDRINPETLYFPFAYGNQWVSMIVSDLEALSPALLTEEHHSAVQSIFTPGQSFAAEMKLSVRAFSADDSEPLMMDGALQWFMIGDVAHAILAIKTDKDDNPLIVWEYRAPWNLSATEKLLLPNNNP